MASLRAPWALPAFLALELLPFASCTALSAAGDPTGADSGSPLSIEAVYSDRTLDSIDLDIGNTGTNVGTRFDRQRLEARLAFGSTAVRWRFSVFGERFGNEHPLGPDTDFGIGGLGFGASGALPLADGADAAPTDARIVFPFDWDLSAAAGDDTAGTVDKIGYGELRGSIGIGAEWRAWRPSIGVAASFVSGIIDDDSQADEGTFSGLSTGAYGQLELVPQSTPVAFHARVVRGDLDAFEIGLGAHL